MAPPDEQGIFLDGAFGVGKSAVLDLLGDRLAAWPVAFSLMDVDWFHRSHPPRSDDPLNVLGEARNIAAVWREYRSAGPRLLVIAGVIRDRSDLDRYQTATGLRLSLIRLTASPEVRRERLLRRYGGVRPDALAWHLDDGERTARQIAEADLDDLVIDTDTLDASAVADRVLRFAEDRDLVGPRG